MRSSAKLAVQLEGGDKKDDRRPHLWTCGRLPMRISTNPCATLDGQKRPMRVRPPLDLPPIAASNTLRGWPSQRAGFESPGALEVFAFWFVLLFDLFVAEESCPGPPAPHTTPPPGRVGSRWDPVGRGSWGGDVSGLRCGIAVPPAAWPRGGPKLRFVRWSRVRLHLPQQGARRAPRRRNPLLGAGDRGSPPFDARHRPVPSDAGRRLVSGAAAIVVRGLARWARPLFGNNRQGPVLATEPLPGGGPFRLHQPCQVACADFSHEKLAK